LSEMPIRRELRCLYPPHWRELSRRIRFERAGGRCQACGRPHLVWLRCLPDGRWFDEATCTWRNRQGKPCRWPDLIEAAGLRSTRVVLAAAHLDGNPANNRLRNLRSLCQRCHVLHDVPHHTRQRWLTYRRRWAAGDLFLGPYAVVDRLIHDPHRPHRLPLQAAAREEEAGGARGSGGHHRGQAEGCR
jgi:hypothetical protein